MRTVQIAAVLAAMLMFLTACGSAAPAPVSGDVTISVKNTTFNVGELKVPANRPFTIAFTNNDGVPHNVAIYTDGSASTKLFVGDLITSSSTVYRVPALKPGRYYFRCDLHPEMNGTIIAQ